MRLADGGWVFDPVCTSGVFLFLFFCSKVDYCEARIWCGVPPWALGVFV